MNISWRKSFQDSDRIDPSQGGATLALSAFMLSSLSHDHARKNLLREIWESGAGVIVSADVSSCPHCAVSDKFQPCIGFD